jgi:hypothetical protein
MTKKADYTAEEWQILLDAPALAGLGVMMAGKSGLGTMKEAVALTQSVLSGSREQPTNELVQSIIDARLKGGERSTAETLSGNPYQGVGREKFTDIVAEKCKAVADLLTAKSTPEEAAGFKTWVLSIGDQVAKAAREGGFLGFGGTQVSAEEVTMIDRIKASFSV